MVARVKCDWIPWPVDRWAGAQRPPTDRRRRLLVEFLCLNLVVVRPATTGKPAKFMKTPRRWVRVRHWGQFKKYARKRTRDLVAGCFERSAGCSDLLLRKWIFSTVRFRSARAFLMFHPQYRCGSNSPFALSEFAQTRQEW